MITSFHNLALQVFLTNLSLLQPSLLIIVNEKQQCEKLYATAICALSSAGKIESLHTMRSHDAV